MRIFQLKTSLIAHTMAVAVAVVATAAPTQVFASNELKFASELDSCVAAVNQHVNYDAAARVRHTIALLKKAGNGYVMRINTAVYADNATSPSGEYQAYCVAKGIAAPVKFRIKEKARETLLSSR